MKSHPRVEILSTYLDAELSPPARRRLEGHLEGCSECRRRLWGLRRVAQRLAEMERIVAPPHLGDEVRRRAALAAGRQSSRERWERGIERFTLDSSLLPAFAVIFALVLIVYLLTLGVHLQRPAAAPPAQSREEAPAAQAQETARPRPAPRRQPAEPVAAITPDEGSEVGSPRERSAAVRAVAGRVFERRGDVWIERGLEPSSPVTRLRFEDRVVQEWLVDRPELRELRQLGAPVRLLLDQEIVEIAFSAP